MTNMCGMEAAEYSIFITHPACAYGLFPLLLTIHRAIWGIVCSLNSVDGFPNKAGLCPAGTNLKLSGAEKGGQNQRGEAPSPAVLAVILKTGVGYEFWAITCLASVRRVYQCSWHSGQAHSRHRLEALLWEVTVAHATGFHVSNSLRENWNDSVFPGCELLYRGIVANPEKHVFNPYDSWVA